MSRTVITKIDYARPRKGGKSPRVTIAIEPNTARVFRKIARTERLELSELLAQALIAWVERWRPEIKIEFDGPGGPTP
jgi:hypothetical protein